MMYPVDSFEQWIKDNLEELTTKELEEQYNNYLDALQSNITILYPNDGIQQLSYLPSRTLRAIDPIAYRDGYLNWIDQKVKVDEFIEVDEIYYWDDDQRDIEALWEDYISELDNTDSGWSENLAPKERFKLKAHGLEVLDQRGNDLYLVADSHGYRYQILFTVDRTGYTDTGKVEIWEMGDATEIDPGDPGLPHRITDEASFWREMNK